MLNLVTQLTLLQIFRNVRMRYMYSYTLACDDAIHATASSRSKFFVNVMDSHDVVCIFLFICGGATCWLTRWLIGGDQRWRALLFD